MNRYWTPLALVYLGISFVGLAVTWWFNITALMEHSDWFSDWFDSGPAVSSLGFDLLLGAVAASIFIIVEARRLGMRGGWIYVVLSTLTAFAFTFPLFLAMRQRRLTELGGNRTGRDDVAPADERDHS